MGLTKEEILKSPPTIRQVSTPEWGGVGHVYVRACAASQMEIIQQSLSSDDASLAELTSGFARLCILFVCDREGICLFTEDDLESLLMQPMAPLKRCAEAGLALNGLNEADELEGNSASASIADSPST